MRIRICYFWTCVGERPLRCFWWTYEWICVEILSVFRTTCSSPTHLRETGTVTTTAAESPDDSAGLIEKPLHQLLACVRSAPPDFLRSSPAKEVKFEVGGEWKLKLSAQLNRKRGQVLILGSWHWSSDGTKFLLRARTDFLTY